LTLFSAAYFFLSIQMSFETGTRNHRSSGSRWQDMVTSEPSWLTESTSQMESEPGRFTRSPMRGMKGSVLGVLGIKKVSCTNVRDRNDSTIAAE
jgi:hypothetical protein